MRLTQLHGEPKSTLVGPAHAQRTPATARRCRYSHGLIRRLITVTDREGVVLSSGACRAVVDAATAHVTVTACGTCKHCLTGWETLCLKQLDTGYSVDGCYAEYFLAEAAFAAKVPDGIDPFEAAPLSCAGVTTYKAVKVGNVRPADLVAISGVGGLGHLAVQYAKIFGGTVAAIEITDEKLQLAKELGADIVIDARTEDPAAVLQAHGGADVAIGLAVDDKSFATAYAGLRRGGRLVLVAMPAAGTLSIPVFDTVLNGVSVIGSIVGTRADLLDVFALHAAGQTRVIYETRPLASVNESIAEVLHGQAKARIVLTP
jgi:alcohol dehydrogenase, propanol-preferring